MSLRDRLLRITLALVVAAGALLAAGPPTEASAASAGCSVKCPDGSSCAADPEPGQYCSCGCSFWGQKTSVCTCQTLKTNPQA